MKVAIVAAMKEEVKYFIDKLENYNTKQINNFTFYTGKLYDVELVLVVSGIGKVFAGVLLTTLFDYFDVDLVINVGVAGGFANKTSLGNVIIGKKLFYGDVNLIGINNYQYGQLPNMPRFFTTKSITINKDFPFVIQFGDILTSDTFVSELDLVESIISNHFNDENIIACDMETTAFAQTCYFFNKDFIVIRGISDIIGRENEDLAYNYENLQKASLNSCLVLDYYLSNLKSL